MSWIIESFYTNLESIHPFQSWRFELEEGSLVWWELCVPESEYAFPKQLYVVSRVFSNLQTDPATNCIQIQPAFPNRADYVGGIIKKHTVSCWDTRLHFCDVTTLGDGDLRQFNATQLDFANIQRHEAACIQVLDVSCIPVQWRQARIKKLFQPYSHCCIYTCLVSFVGFMACFDEWIVLSELPLPLFNSSVDFDNRQIEVHVQRLRTVSTNRSSVSSSRRFSPGEIVWVKSSFSLRFSDSDCEYFEAVVEAHDWMSGQVLVHLFHLNWFRVRVTSHFIVEREWNESNAVGGGSEIATTNSPWLYVNKQIGWAKTEIVEFNKKFQSLLLKVEFPQLDQKMDSSTTQISHNRNNVVNVCKQFQLWVPMDSVALSVSVPKLQQSDELEQRFKLKSGDLWFINHRDSPFPIVSIKGGLIGFHTKPDRQELISRCSQCLSLQPRKQFNSFIIENRIDKESIVQKENSTFDPIIVVNQNDDSEEDADDAANGFVVLRMDEDF